MSINSQFLYSYIDELIRSQWVPWSENYLSEVPLEEFHVAKGFQNLSGSNDSTNRTRAGECFRLGLINSRLVNERLGQRSGFPLGWEKVCNGFSVHTRLGYFSYIIGKAYAAKADDIHLISALNAIATIQILLIAFKHEDRWYSTVNIFNFVRLAYEKKLERPLKSQEIRYLTGAVLNTLDGQHCSDLIESYNSKKELPPMYFSLRGSDEEVELTTDNFQALLADSRFNINSIGRHKAALFWANEDRGIYSRASYNSGSSFLSRFLEVDRSLSSQSEPSLIHSIIESIYDQKTSKDFIDTFSSIVNEYPELLAEWANIMARLESGVITAIEYFEERDEPEFFKESLRKVKETLEADYVEVEESEDPKEKKDINNKALYETKNKAKKEIPSLEALMKVISEDYGSIFVETPIPKEIITAGNNIQRTIRKFDPVERDAKNRALGFCGEEFVMEVEKHRLSSSGHSNLAQKVKWISKELGDGAGYDILSYDENGSTLFIEVKTTKGGASTQFYLSENELQVSKDKGDSYRLYRVYDIADAPKIYIVKGALDAALNLKPISYRATAKSS